MLGKFQNQLQDELATIKDAGLFKKERIITNPQGASIRVSTGEEVLNFCANNYLGLSSHPEVVQAAKDALDTHGYGMNFIHPVTSKLDLILSVERNQLEFPEEYEVSRTGFLAGVNVSEFSGFGKGNWKAGGFAVAGMGWHNSKREILTNTTSSGFWMLLLIIKAWKLLQDLISTIATNHPRKAG